MEEQIKEMELLQQKKRDQEEAEYSDNNFWRIQSATEAQTDVDELLRELEATDETPGQDSGGGEQSSNTAEEEDDESEESIKDDSGGKEADQDNKEQNEQSPTNS